MEVVMAAALTQSKHSTVKRINYSSEKLGTKAPF